MIRLRYALLTGLALLAVALSTAPFTPKLVWNASASVPLGLYAVRELTILERDDLVAVRPPAHLVAFLDERGYLPSGATLLKCIAALPGQQVCRTDRSIAIDGIVVGEAQRRDHAGRPLPVWEGCQTIAADDVFLMNVSVDDSLDGRYFGPTSSRLIIGRAGPLWTDDEADARFAWRGLLP